MINSSRQLLGSGRSLKKIFEDNLPREKRIEELRKWCHYLLREANRDGLIVTAIHPKLTLEELKEASPREVITVEANTVSNLLVTSDVASR